MLLMFIVGYCLDCYCSVGVVLLTVLAWLFVYSRCLGWFIWLGWFSVDVIALHSFVMLGIIFVCWVNTVRLGCLWL